MSKEDIQSFIRSSINEEFLKIKESLSKQIKNSSTDEFLTCQETADFCKVHKQTIQDWTRNGILKRYRIGNGRGRILYKRSEVEKAIISYQNDCHE